MQQIVAWIKFKLYELMGVLLNYMHAYLDELILFVRDTTTRRIKEKSRRKVF